MSSNRWRSFSPTFPRSGILLRLGESCRQIPLVFLSVYFRLFNEMSYVIRLRVDLKGRVYLRAVSKDDWTFS